jgi:hypothetical protein
LEQAMSDVLAQTLDWFHQAVSEPTPRNRQIQVAVHLEEFHEMMTALNLQEHSQGVHELSEAIKQDTFKYQSKIIDRQELLDSLCDQIVTAVGVARMFGLDIVGALKEVNASNYSKFVDGKPLFDENGKIKKGPNYFKPDLSKFV